MNNSNPSIEHLKAMVSLEERRIALQKEIDAIQAELGSLQKRLFAGASAVGHAITETVAKLKPGRPKGKGKRGAVSEGILAGLAAAGEAGIRVRDLAASLGAKAGNIHAWFQSTAKKHPSIQKLSKGVYRLVGGHSAQPVKATRGRKKGAKAAKVATKAGKPGRRRSGKRGALAEKVMATLSAAGSQGVAIKDIAQKVGSQYRNISIWFATTGKKNPKIKKVGPARYKLAA